MHERQDATGLFLAEHARSHADDLTDLLVKTIERDNPGYRASGVVPRADLWHSCRDNIGRVLELLGIAVAEHGLPSDTPGPTTPTTPPTTQPARPDAVEPSRDYRWTTSSARSGSAAG